MLIFEEDENLNILEAIANNVKIYPNPTKDIVYIENAVDLEVKIYSLRGELLLKEKNKHIDISRFASGIYILQVGKKQLQIIKE